METTKIHRHWTLSMLPRVLLRAGVGARISSRLMPFHLPLDSTDKTRYCWGWDPLESLNKLNEEMRAIHAIKGQVDVYWMVLSRRLGLDQGEKT